jgi:Zn-dependent peptidase ImmA (M78 family)
MIMENDILNNLSLRVLENAVKLARYDKHPPKIVLTVLDKVKYKKRVTFNQLRSFSKSVSVPIPLLLENDIEPIKIPITDMRTIKNKAVKEVSTNLINTIYDCMQKQSWFREFRENEGFDDIEFVSSESIKSPVSDIANKISNLLKFNELKKIKKPERLFIKLKDALNSLGVLVVAYGTNPKNISLSLDKNEFRGFAISDKIAPLIFVNTKDDIKPKIFTLLHEFTHILLGDTALSGTSLKENQGIESELFCNNVASEILIPSEQLKQITFINFSTEELKNVSKRFNTSVFVLIKKLLNDNIISWNKHIEIWDREKKNYLNYIKENQSKNTKSGGNYYNNIQSKTSKDFILSVYSSAITGKTNFTDAYKLIGVSSYKTMKKLVESI